MEHRACQVLHRSLQPLQALLVTLQVQEVKADYSNKGEHLSREQVRDQDVAGWAESTGETCLHPFCQLKTSEVEQNGFIHLTHLLIHR